jgi:exosome complex component RRP4
MIRLIKEKTQCNIFVGQNGLIWVEGKEKAKAIEAILTIDKKSHIYGLTEEIEKLLAR